MVTPWFPLPLLLSAPSFLRYKIHRHNQHYLSILSFWEHSVCPLDFVPHPSEALLWGFPYSSTKTYFMDRRTVPTVLGRTDSMFLL